VLLWQGGVNKRQQHQSRRHAKTTQPYEIETPTNAMVNAFDNTPDLEQTRGRKNIHKMSQCTRE